MTLRNPDCRRRGPALAAALVLSALAGACTTFEDQLARTRGNNALFDDTKSEDLGARGPTRVKQGGARVPAGPSRAEIYPGTDGVEPRRRPRAAPGQAAIEKASDGYQLNFENAPIADVAKVVLGDTLQQTYVIDRRVQGQVTMTTGRSVTTAELLSVFEVALRMNNAALISDRTGYRIIPLGEALAGDTGGIQPLRPGEAAQPGYGISVFPLRHMAAETVLKLLEAFVARAGSVRAEAAGNLLLIRGTSRDREAILDVAATVDVDWLKGQSAGIYPLAHATPDEMITELKQVMQTEQGEAGAKLMRFQPINRLNAVLVLTRTAKQLKVATEWVRRLDKANQAGQNVYVYQVENGKAVEIAVLLNDTFGTPGTGTASQAFKTSPRGEIAPGRDTGAASSGSAFRRSGTDGTGGASTSGGGGSDTQGGGGGQTGLGTRPGTSPTSTSRPTSPITTSGIGPGGTPGQGGSQQALDVRIVADESNNALIIRARPPDYQKILSALRQIDKAPLQVLINATIAEVTLSNELRYGVQVYLRSRDFGGPSNQGSVGWHGGPSLTLLPKFPGLNFLLGSAADPRMILDALSGITTVKVVSSPSVVVVDNQTAILKVGDEVPINTQQVTSVITPGAPVVNSIQYRETGVILKVTPRANSNGLVTMDVEQEISQVVANATAESLTPTISQRRVSSRVAVFSGQTVVLGGLISEQNERRKQGLPIIDKIPLVGELIGTNTKTGKRTELIVFIKPQVIRSGEDASQVSEELRAKLKSMAFEPEPPKGRWSTRSSPRPEPRADTFPYRKPDVPYRDPRPDRHPYRQ